MADIQYDAGKIYFDIYYDKLYYTLGVYSGYPNFEISGESGTTKSNYPLKCCPGDTIIFDIKNIRPVASWITFPDDMKCIHDLNLNGNITRYETDTDYIIHNGTYAYLNSINKEYLINFWDCTNTATLIDFNIPKLNVDSTTITFTTHTKYDEK